MPQNQARGIGEHADSARWVEHNEPGSYFSAEHSGEIANGTHHGTKDKAPSACNTNELSAEIVCEIPFVRSVLSTRGGANN